MCLVRSAMAFLNYPKTHIGNIFLFFLRVESPGLLKYFAGSNIQAFPGAILRLLVPNDFLDRDSSLRLSLASFGRDGRDCHSAVSLSIVRSIGAGHWK